MPRGWKTVAWNVAFVTLAALPASAWADVVGQRWVPFAIAVCAAGNLFSAWVKDNQPK